MFISLPIKKVLLLVFFFITVISIALVVLYLKKNQYLGKAGSNQSQVAGRQIWKGESVKQNANIDNPQSVKREGVKIYNIDPNGQKQLLTIQGSINEVDQEDEFLVITQDGASETIKFSEIDKVFITDHTRGNVRSEVTIQDPRIKKGSSAAYNPRRNPSGISALIIL